MVYDMVSLTSGYWVQTRKLTSLTDGFNILPIVLIRKDFSHWFTGLHLWTMILLAYIKTFIYRKYDFWGIGFYIPTF